MAMANKIETESEFTPEQTASLLKIAAEIRAGKAKGYTIEESYEQIQKQKAKYVHRV